MIKRGDVFVLIAWTALAMLSLALNGVVILELLELRQTAQQVVVDTRRLVTRFAEETFSYTVKVDQEMPVSAEIPLSESLTVPISTVVPISTTVLVPVNLGLATYRLAVPIETVLPVDLEVTVPVSQVVQISAAVSLDADIPVEVAVF
ncbi:MAG: hypothetical protein PVJ55_09180 [Anaerolineae bacterium]|jgi:hypothetical protein